MSRSASMITMYPEKIPLPELHRHLQGAIAPRPIALASTIDEQGRVNLSPFSFFNLFSTNPPILIFSPSRRGRDNTTKHTYENVLHVPEVVINVVSFDIVQQTSLASVEYPEGTNEFIKAGFTPEKSVLVKPPRVRESPAAFECKVNQVIPLGEKGGAGNLIVCEILLAHFRESIFDEHGQIDPYKIDLMARMGGDWYCRAQGDAIFKVPKPTTKIGIGVDQIPAAIRNSTVLTGNDLGMLGNVESLPPQESAQAFENEHPEVKESCRLGQEAVHRLAQQFLQKSSVEEAWKTLLSYHTVS